MDTKSSFIVLGLQPFSVCFVSPFFSNFFRITSICEVLISLILFLPNVLLKWALYNLTLSCCHLSLVSQALAK